LATNLQIKFIKSLHLKKNRVLNQLFIIEGDKNIEELIQQKDFKIHSIYAVDFVKLPQNTKKLNIEEVSEKQMEQITCLASSSNVLALVHYPVYSNLNKVDWLQLFLDDIKDPGNLGTIIRTAHWYGIEQIFLSPGCVDVFNPKTIQSSMGSIFYVKTKIKSFEEVILESKYTDIYGALFDGVSHRNVNFKSNSLLVIGSESHGISKGVQDKIQTKVTIPRFSNTESLNAAIATSILIDQFRAEFGS
jgi:TrmH family RNA methyltransferase